MQLLLYFGVIFLAVNDVAAQNPNYIDWYCDNDPSNMWLDIVVVVDNSRNMTNDNLELVAASIADLFPQTRIGTNHTDPRSTRIGLVTYSHSASIAADLNQFQSFHDLYQTADAVLSSVTDSAESYLALGLHAAEQILQSGRSNGYRSNYKQLIIVYAATYMGTGDLDPLPIAQRLANNDIHIATIDMNTYYDRSIGDGLQMISTDGMFRSYSIQMSYYLQYQILRNLNCFCKPSWFNYLMPPFKTSSRTCVHVSTQTTNWLSAKFACQNLDSNSYLVTELSADKHNFVQTLFQNTTSSTAGYHIGLNYVNGGWYWQQPAGQQLIQLDSYTSWNYGYPASMTTNTGVANMAGSSGTVGWQNVSPYNDNKYYVCETRACDTTNYCP